MTVRPCVSRIYANMSAWYYWWEVGHVTDCTRRWEYAAAAGCDVNQHLMMIVKVAAGRVLRDSTCGALWIPSSQALHAVSSLHCMPAAVYGLYPYSLHSAVYRWLQNVHARWLRNLHAEMQRSICQHICRSWVEKEERVIYCSMRRGQQVGLNIATCRWCVTL